MRRACLRVFVVWLLLSSCGENPAFIEKSLDVTNGTSNSDSAGGDGTSGGSGDSLGKKIRKFAYGKSVTPVVADYLFVLDNSVSMVKYSDKVARGLAAIPASSFPESSKLAVMTTMSAVDPTSASLLAHPDVSRQDYACIDQEPGFLELVDAESVNRFKSCTGVRQDFASKYAITPCKDSWFEPFAQNDSGQRCFSAALQNPFSPVGCEAGLLALEQILKRNSSNRLFRNNASVNVIFVSDEQEGCKSPETRGQYSDAKKLVQLIKSNSVVSSVKFHGIVPITAPDGVRKYSTEINATGGIVIPMDQERQDYREVIQKIIESKVDLTSNEFDLGEIASTISKVEVNGVTTQDFVFTGNRIVKVSNLDPTKPSLVTIEFN